MEKIDLLIKHSGQRGQAIGLLKEVATALELLQACGADAYQEVFMKIDYAVHLLQDTPFEALSEFYDKIVQQQSGTDINPKLYSELLKSLWEKGHQDEVIESLRTLARHLGDEWGTAIYGILINNNFDSSHPNVKSWIGVRDDLAGMEYQGKINRSLLEAFKSDCLAPSTTDGNS